MKFALAAKLGRQALVIDKNSPQLLFGVGVVGSVCSTVLACRATLKAEEVLQTAAGDLDVIRMATKAESENYSEQDRKKDKAIVITRTTVELTKLYAPAIVVGGLSIAALTKSHNILQDRNTALMAAYAAVDTAFTRYRERVVEKYGEEEDRHFRHGAEEVRVTENGKTVTRVRIPDEEPTMYARFFDEYSKEWSPEPEYNLVFLRHSQNWANDMLNTRGHLFLNEVYDQLGIERSRAGAVVGWVRGQGDSYVDFGLYNEDRNAREFINGREGAILLDFNVDGVIYDKIDHSEGRLKWQS